jgi:subtilisin family serine protease
VSKKRLLIALVALGLLLTLPTSPTGAEEPAVPDGLTVVEDGVQVAGDVEAVSVIVTLAPGANPDAIAAGVGGTVVHRFVKTFNGASVVLPGSGIDSLAKSAGVTGVYQDQLLQPATEVSPEFIGAPGLWDDLGGTASAGEGTIVGVLDSGIWPEHPSMSDPDPSGEAFPAPSTVPGSNGFGSGGPRSTCDFGNSAWNANDVPFTCNNKLIGAYTFLDTYKAVVGLLPSEFDSARDDNGHGTHTATTAAGNNGVAASIFGVPRGAVSGIAPRAHVIAYRVCGDQGCYQSDSVAAVEQAILDDVDSINFSISGGGSPYSDVVEQAFAVAYDEGVFVSASAGNSGPTADTVAHRGPWTMTVGASTTDRHFISTVSLEADNSDTLTLEGATVTDGISAPTPVVFPPAGQELCLNPFATGTFSGEIVVCQRGVIARVDKSFNVAAGGAGGMLLYNPTQQGLATDNHFIPSVHLENDAGAALLDFMSTHTGVTGTFTQGVATTVQGDKMADFSSRGGPGQNLGISKPDITAPGVQILAGHTPLPATSTGGLPGELFQAIQGTSMSSPHIAGAAALLKDLHPDWTPGQIKSAMMLTADGNHVKEDGSTPADPFDYGSGRIDLARAGDPGLSISDTTANFFALQDQLWNSNYPSLYLPTMTGEITVTRTLQSESAKNRVWKTSVSAPADVTVAVPTTVNVKAGQTATLDITVSAPTVPEGEVRHAWVFLTNKGDTLRFPITLVRNQPGVTLDKTCTPAEVEQYGAIDCTITAQNTTFADAAVSIDDRIPPGHPVDEASVVGATYLGDHKLAWDGTLFGAGLPVLDVVASSPPFGFFPLASLGVTPFGCPSNCDDGGFILNVPAFTYLGDTYSSVIWSVNGTVEVGTASGLATSFANQNFPNPSLPNNLLAPWWTDLNLGAGGNWYVGVLGAGPNQYTVYEWANVPRFGDAGSTFSFQIWVQNGPSGNIWFAYDVFSGDTGDGTVGAENADGTVGESYYYDGAGSLPWGSSGLQVRSVPGTPGEVHTITFTMSGDKLGPYTNCAELTSDAFQGVNVSCSSGTVLAP